jgi:hypothetical protein
MSEMAYDQKVLWVNSNWRLMALDPDMATRPEQLSPFLAPLASSFEFHAQSRWNICNNTYPRRPRRSASFGDPSSLMGQFISFALLA